MAAKRKRVAGREVAVVEQQRPEVAAIGGGLEGAERTSNETMRWVASRLSPDQIINGFSGLYGFGAKNEADARGRDVVTNDGYAQGVVDINRDSIVGAQFRLSSHPNFTVLQNQISRSFDEVWAEEFQLAIEETFNLVGDSNFCWLDATGTNTFTGLVRLAIAGFVYTGEVLATGEWISEGRRPFNTAIQMIAPIRMSNPLGQIDTKYLRNGVVKDDWGRATGYWIREAYPTEYMVGLDPFRWKLVDAEKPWGRQMVIHIKDAIQPAQTRGISGLVAVLKQMRMTKKFQEIVLQNAVINASYAATIESELPSDVIAAAMGAGQLDPTNSFMGVIHRYLEGLRGYLEQANGVAVDGAKMPHLFPGTKLHTQTLGTPGGVGTEFETSLLRHISAGLGISHEEFANDFSKTNYSSGKASMVKTTKHMMAKKKFIADRFANYVFMLWAEEYLNAGNLPMPRNYDWRVLYTPDGYTNSIVKDALFSCDWVGTGRGQIDELKETQAALLRINGGLSTHEAEIAKQGGDYRKVFPQIAREQKMAKNLGIDFSLAAEKSGAASGQKVMQEAGQSDASTVRPPAGDDLKALIKEAVGAATAHTAGRKEKTTVTKHDAQGRILEFVKEEIVT